MKYELDNIYNEDSYKAIKDIHDNSIDCIYTDVPYLYHSGDKGSSPLALRIAKTKKDLKTLGIIDGFDYKIYDDFIRVMKKINIFIWCSKLQIQDTLNYFLSKGCYFEILTWNKLNPTPSTNNNWLPDIEYCLYFREKGVRVNDGYTLKSKWYVSPLNKREKDLFNHPTIKPFKLVKRHIEHATKPNDIVADFFIGSGTIPVAAKESGRRYIGFEIDKEYFKIAKDRLNGITANGQTSMFTKFEKLDI